MRCNCQVCGTYMVHAESFGLGCVCPECGQRCKQCLGTNTVVSRDDLKKAAINLIRLEQTENSDKESYEDSYRD